MEDVPNMASKEASAAAAGPAMTEQQRNEAEFERNLLLLLRDYVSNTKTHPGHRLCPWEFREIKLLAQETTRALLDRLAKSQATIISTKNEAAYDIVRKLLNCSHVEFEQFILLNQEQRSIWMTGLKEEEIHQLELCLNPAIIHYRTVVLNTAPPSTKNPPKDKAQKPKRGRKKSMQGKKRAPAPAAAPQTPKPNEAQDATEPAGRRSHSAEPRRRGRDRNNATRGGRNQHGRSPVFTRSKQRLPNAQ